MRDREVILTELAGERKRDGQIETLRSTASRRRNSEPGQPIRAGSSKPADQDAKRANRVAALSGEMENVGKFGAPCARRTVYGDSPLTETER